MKQITVTELAALDRRRVIDVREPDEYAAGHAAGAINIPLGDLEHQLSNIPSTGPVYVICQSGRRSSAAVETLTAHGIDAINVDGGTTAWQQNQLPLT